MVGQVLVGSVQPSRYSGESLSRSPVSIRARGQVVKAGVCKTPIRRFDSGRALLFLLVEWRYAIGRQQ